ncbi:type I restriction-modification system subunit M [Microbacterium laevaniformans]|uniref:type I restriction-modification system subunit M n=1 Tax=Microbacterium laevaniformans TaxID=36807 RepID=UPI00195CF86F|nr:type I restriction-modification system subunit M [Microbacterium laevaniformans]MBM7752519.1 type I restriction enzyme M protein [Microbacterium laevaniformans]GLJ63413.1 type I restriction-modification system subunit M [Microbacterium laevaniformans]
MSGIVQVAKQFHSDTEAWDLKSYVLGALFYRFLSEDLAAFINAEELAAGATDFDYADLDDATAEQARLTTIDEKGYFLLPSQLYETVQSGAAKDENLNETLVSVFKALEATAVGTASENVYKGLFSGFDPNALVLGDTVDARNKRLAGLLTAIAGYEMNNAADDFDELLRYYVTTAGKKGGDHFTPPTIAELVARLATQANPEARSVYDPAFGSGSLLIQTRQRLAHEATVSGQELVRTNYNMARMNLLVHGIEFGWIDLDGGASTLTDPSHRDDEPFDIIVSNPKWSAKWVGKDDAVLINDDRFAPAGVLAPKQYHDLAFTMHAASWLATDGVAVLVQFPGTLYRGAAEAKIRQYLVTNNFVDTVIQLPPDWGYGVTVAGVVVILRKAKRDSAVLFVDASKLCDRVGNKNELLEQHQTAILDAVASRGDIEHFTRLVPNEDIALQQFDLSVSRYVQPADNRVAVDIRALNAKIAGIVERQNELRTGIDAIVADLEGAAS